MKKELERIINNYGINELESYLETVQSVEDIYIGVLGEFNSGKSSLLNSILGKTVLPAMDIPTTKSITYLKANTHQETEIEYFEIKDDESEEKISLIDFQDIAKGNRKGEAIVSVKSNEFLNKGYVFIDTPGISSLDQTDIDITYGLLTKLDGVLICIDINTGTLNESIKSFLKSPELELIKDKILFVLTRSDDKSSDSISRIIEDFKKDINHYLNVDDIDNRILSFSSIEVLEAGKLEGLENLINLFEVSINSRKKQMIELRIKKQEESLKLKVIDALKDLKSKLSFDDSEFKTEENKLESEIALLDKQKIDLKMKLDKFEDQLLDDIKAINANTKLKVSTECGNVTPDITILNEIYITYIKKLEAHISDSVARFFKEHKFTGPNNLHIDFSELSSSINSIIKRKEAITGLVTAVAVAAATGGTSVAANAAETGGVMAAKQVTKEASKEVAKKVITKKVAEETAKKVAVETAKKATKEAAKEAAKSTIKRTLANNAVVFISKLGDVAKEINPIEQLGAFLAQKSINLNMDRKISEIGRKVCNQTVMTIEEQIEFVFHEIDEKLRINQSNLDVAFASLKKGKSEAEKMKLNIQSELIKLG